METSTLYYTKQLDGIRAIAVIMVILGHWLHFNFAGKFFPSSVGVDIFFVLSGFLITRILLVSKKLKEKKLISDKRSLIVKNFIIRRALRIFPVYYLLIVLLYLGFEFFPTPLNEDFGWYILYLQNIQFYLHQQWPGGKLSHLWSLAVEEQFYLVWPFVIIFTGKQNIPKVIITTLVAGVLFTELAPVFLPLPGFTSILAPACIHAFACGALVSFYQVYHPEKFSRFSEYLGYAGMVSFAVYIISGLYESRIADQRILIAISTSALIARIYHTGQKATPLKAFLGSAPLVHLGKISYGLYLYHNFVPTAWKAILQVLNKHNYGGYILTLSSSGWLFYLECAIILYVICSCSYYFFEKHFLNLKEKFNYN